MQLSTQDLISEAHTWLDNGKQAILKFYELLWRIRNESFAEKPHEEFVTFCKEEFEIKAPAITKAEKIGDAFYAHGYLPDSFRDATGKYRDSEVVYSAAKMEGTPEEKFSQALTLTRPDVRRNAADLDKHTPKYELVCTHPGCWIPKDSHPVYDCP